MRYNVIAKGMKSMSTAALERTFDIVRAMPESQREIVISFVASLHQKTTRRREKGSVAAAARRMAGSIAQYDDGRPYDEIRYEAMKERYGLSDRR